MDLSRRKKEFLRVHHLEAETQDNHILKSLTFCLYEGETVGFLEKDDSGMDALLSILCGSEKQVSGKLYLEGREVSGWEETEARKQGIYRIHPESSLIQHMDVAENLCLILECQIPSLIIQPIVENAVHHGLERRSGKGMVRISAFLTEQRLIIRISDDGAGMSRTQAEALREKLNAGMDGLITSGTRHGIALVNISERLKLYFGEEYGLSFSSAEQCGTIVELTLPRKVEKTFKNSTEKVMES